MNNQINQRPISEGRNVVLQDFPHVVHEFERMGWYPFLSVYGWIFPPLVYEFYTNFQFIADQKRVNFRMHGNLYSYSLTQFGELLGISSVTNSNPPHIPHERMTQFLCRVCVPYRTILRTGILKDYLRPEVEIQYEIIRSNVYHRDANEDVLSETEASLLWCLKHNVKINNAHLVASRMNQVHNGPEICLPYGHLLDSLFSKIGVLHGPIPNREISTLPINRASFYEDSESADETEFVDETSIVPETLFPSNYSSETSSTRSDARSYYRR